MVKELLGEPDAVTFTTTQGLEALEFGNVNPQGSCLLVYLATLSEEDCLQPQT